jgi:hypothetical protein
VCGFIYVDNRASARKLRRTRKFIKQQTGQQISELSWDLRELSLSRTILPGPEPRLRTVVSHTVGMIRVLCAVNLRYCGKTRIGSHVKQDTFLEV